MVTNATQVRSIVRSVAHAARQLGLDASNPELLRAGANVVVHLAPSPVVARVATLTAEMRDGADAYLRRERDVTRHLVTQGLPVIAPTTLVEPGPHVADGWSFLLLEYQQLQPIDLDSADHAVRAAEAMVAVLAGLDGAPAELGAGDEGQPWDEIDRLVAATTGPDSDPTVTNRLRSAITHLRGTEPADPWRLVHGDAHRGNVALVDGEVTWFDFEDCNRRPLAWDLATLCRAWPAAGAEACRLMDVDPGSASMRWHHELRDLYALLWNLLYAQRDASFVQPTKERLAAWMDAQVADW